MRYTVNYFGAFFSSDNDTYNCYETNSWAEAREMFYNLISTGDFNDAYIKDEEYDCCYRYYPETGECEWD